MATVTALRARPDRTISPAEAALEAAIVEDFLATHVGALHRSKYIEQLGREIAAFRTFVARPLWEWEPPDMNLYSLDLRKRNVAADTMRRKQGAIRGLLDHARHPAYPWNERCLALTGREIRQICTPSNTAHHRRGAATTQRRNFVRLELTRLFTSACDYLDRAPRPREWLARATHYAMLHFMLAFSARDNDVAMADLADLAPAVTPEIADFSAFEDMLFRFGKAHDGGEPKRQSVPATYLFRESLAVVAWYVREIRPQLKPNKKCNDALFVGARGNRFKAQYVSEVCGDYIRRAGLSRDLTPHCMRHTYETMHRESGLDLATVSDLMRHESELTTQIYDHMGDDVIKEHLLDFQRVLMEKCRAVR